MLSCSSDILDFSEKLGVGAHYKKLDSDWKNAEELEKFLHSFRNNLELLIQKTWVEKADKDRKEKLLSCLTGFIALIKAEDYYKALEEFEAILKELAWLLFGSQSQKEDFLDYVTRIDHQWGLFWQYGGQLEQSLAEKATDKDLQRQLLFLGLCYLTEF